MKSVDIKQKFWILCLILISFCVICQGCRPEVCRRRRDVIDANVTLHLQGCSGQTKPWVRQVAFCLGRSSAEIALKMKDWYSTTYALCYEKCALVRAGTKQMNNINVCVNCFKDKLAAAPFMEQEPLTMTQIASCLDRYIFAALSNELPTFVAETKARGKIILPDLLPSSNWWAVTVRLPCKPPLFQFWNAYCINSFRDDARARDFVLSQNKLVFNQDIMFLATFNDACRFDASQVDIVWDESIPSLAVPQISSIPSRFPPNRNEHGNIFMDFKAIARLEKTDIDGFRESVPNPKRKKRSLRSRLHKLGVIMPCSVRSFTVSHEAGMMVSVKSKGNRHLINPASLLKIRCLRRKLRNLQMLNFTLDYGYESSGCIFGSNEPVLVNDPPPGWINAQEQVTCYTCSSASSEEDCKRFGTTKTCQMGEICQSEIRKQGDQISINKSCKQSLACENNQGNNNRQCRPGVHGSVCRCCCSTDYCNDESHHCT